MPELLFIAVLVGLPLIYLLFVYNSLIARKNQVSNVFASLDALLKKRYDLIPNLVTTVKNYMTHERETLTKITELRAKVQSSRQLTDAEAAQLDRETSKALGSLMVAVENYPELKANENFLHLQSSLNEIEEQISAGRRAYNAIVTDYNNAIEMFPSNIVAGMMGLQKKAWFEIVGSERENVNVEALFSR